MFNPTYVAMIGTIRHQELRQEADDARQSRQLKRSRPGLRQQTGAWLIAAGQQLKGHPLSDPVTPPLLSSQS